MGDGTSVMVQGCLDRLRRGDRAARDELIALASDRLTRLTRKMLGDYARLRRWEETADVAQNALVRLCRALEQTAPPSPQDFYRLAAAQIRRELIDLARHHYGPEGGGANHASVAGQPGAAPDGGGLERGDGSLDPGRLALWTEFHQKAGELPEELRQVFDLLYYQGVKQEEAAELLGVSVRTVKSRWRSARVQLAGLLGGRTPDE